MNIQCTRLPNLLALNRPTQVDILLKSEFSGTSCLTRAKEHSLSCYLAIIRKRTNGFMLFRCKRPYPGFELGSPIPFPTTITMTQSAFPYLQVYIYLTSPPRVRSSTKSILKRSKTGLNSEFSFTYIGWVTTA